MRLPELSLRQLSDVFFRTTEGQRFLQTAEAERQAKRAAQVERLRAATKRHETEIAAAGDKFAKLKAAYDKAIRAAKDAYRALSQQHSLVQGLQHCAEREQAELKRELAETADERIDAFIRDRWSEYSRTQLHSDIRTVVQTEPLMDGARRFVSGLTNELSVEDRLAAIRAAVDAAEKLKYAAVPDVGDALQAIEATIPPVRMEAVRPAKNGRWADEMERVN